MGYPGISSCRRLSSSRPGFFLSPHPGLTFVQPAMQFSVASVQSILVVLLIRKSEYARVMQHNPKGNIGSL